MGGTLVNVKLPLWSTAPDTLVPTTVTVTAVMPSVRPCAADPLDPVDTVPTMVAPVATGAGAGADVADGALLGAVGEP